MSEKFTFKGPTTFIHKPIDSVIQNFQNQYILDTDEQEASLNSELAKLLKLILDSKELEDKEKEEVAYTLHSIAGLIKEKKASRLTLKGTLQAIGRVVEKAADIAKPALEIISKIVSLL